MSPQSNKAPHEQEKSNLTLLSHEERLAVDINPNHLVEAKQLHVEDVRYFIQLAWKNFIIKLTVTAGFIISLMGVVDWIISGSIPEHVKQALMVGAVLTLIILVVATIVRGTGGLLIERRILIGSARKAWEQVKGLEAEKKALLDASDPHRESWSRHCALYGLGVYKYEIQSKVMPDGGLKSNYYYEFAATQEGINAIELFTNIAPDPTPLETPINLDAQTISIDGVQLSSEIVSQSATRLVWKIVGTPPFPTNKRLSFRYSSILPKDSMSMTSEELLKRKEEWEYIFVRVTYPIEQLKMTIELPKGFKLGLHDCDVWFQPGAKVQQTHEYMRLIDSKAFTPRWNEDGSIYFLQLTVKYPVQGLCYALKWRPPTIWVPSTST